MAPTLLPVQIQPSHIRPIAYRILSKKHGLNIQSDALLVLTDTFSARFGTDWRGPKGYKFLEEVAKTWKLQDRGLFIDGAGLAQVINELTKDSKDPKPEGPVAAARLDTISDDPGGVVQEAMNWRHFVRFVTPDIQPTFVFDKVRKQFTQKDPAGKKLSLSLDTSMQYFSLRYHLMMDRLTRDENFQKMSFSTIAAINNTLRDRRSGFEITLIKNVLGRDGAKFSLFGLLSRNANGNLTLEDSSDYIELNVTRANKVDGSFYCPGMFVIVEGIYSASGGSMGNDANVISGCFYVSTMAQPCAERRDVSLEAYGHLDFMGMHADTKVANKALVKIDRRLQKKLTALEKTLDGHRVVMLGANVYLDDPKIMLGLRKFFSQLEDEIQDEQDSANFDIHIVIVMVGLFTSQPLTSSKGHNTLVSNSEEYKSNFDKLAEIVSKCPLVLNNCKLLLIPGSNDPWQSTQSLGKSSSSVLPQVPIPKVFVTRLERLFPKGSLILGWNPMRINYVSQEIVLFRDDMMNKLKRNDLVFQSDLDMEKMQLELEQKGLDKQAANLIGDVMHLPSKVKQSRKLVKTLLDQGNLQPFCKDLRVINPNYQSVMRIEPLPTTMALFDTRFESFEVTYNGCKVSNLGNLIGNQNSRRLNYAEYRPCNKKYSYKTLHF